MKLFRLAGLFLSLALLWPAAAMGDDAAQHLARGHSLFEQEKYQDAEREYRQVSRLKPGDGEAHMMLAYLLVVRQGQYKQGLAEAKLAGKLGSDYLGALAGYQRALAKKAKPFAAHLQLATKLDTIRRNRESLAEYRAAVGLNGNSAKARLGLGLTLMHFKRYPAAIAELQRSLKLDPENPLALYDVACAYALHQEHENAITNLDRALTLAPKLKSFARQDLNFISLFNDPRFVQMTTTE